VPDGVGADPFCSQGWHLDLVDVTFDQGVDAEACDGTRAAIEEDTGCRGAVHNEGFEFPTRRSRNQTGIEAIRRKPHRRRAWIGVRFTSPAGIPKGTKPTVSVPLETLSSLPATHLTLTERPNNSALLRA